MPWKAVAVAAEVDKLTGVTHADVAFYDDAAPTDRVTKHFTFPDGTTQAQMVNEVQAAGAEIRTNGVKDNKLQAHVDEQTVINIP
jgi:hypothetical protein